MNILEAYEAMKQGEAIRVITVDFGCYFIMERKPREDDPEIMTKGVFRIQGEQPMISRWNNIEWDWCDFEYDIVPKEERYDWLVKDD